MTIQIALLLLVITGMLIAMITEALSMDTLAFTVMVVLILGGFVTPLEGISGFSNSATITILCLMILTAGLESTGVVNELGHQLEKLLYAKEWKAVGNLMLLSGIASAFVATTAVVIVFLRVLNKISDNIPTHLSRLLMPLSFAGILGGSCTLIGTSTNLIVSSIAEENNLGAFSMFEFSLIGIVLFFAGLLYFIFIGRHLLKPDRKKDVDLTEEYDVQQYISEVIVPQGSLFINSQIKNTELYRKEVDIIEIKRNAKTIFPLETERLQENDELLIKANLSILKKILRDKDLRFTRTQTIKDDDRLSSNQMILCEVFIKSMSPWVGRKIDRVAIKRDYHAIPLAIKKNTKYINNALEALTINAGDTLLMEVSSNNFQNFYNSHEFIVIQQHEEYSLDTNKKTLAVIIIAAVVLFAALDIFSLLETTLAGCVIMFITKCTTLQKAYKRIDWSIIFLLAGVIPLGAALKNTGADQYFAELLSTLLKESAPTVIIAIFYLMTTLMSSVISNNATAILFAPFAIALANSFNIDARPLLITIMIAANMSFLSPIGYQTNTLIYSTGYYKIKDFIKVGGILSIIIWLLVIWLIPLFYF